MKKIILYLGFLASFLFLANQADATHIMGGEVTWVCNTQGEYIFTFKTYRDCSGSASGGPNTSWRIQNYPNVGQTFTLTENTTITRPDAEIGPNCRVGSPGFQTYSCTAGDPEVVFEYVRVMNAVRLNGTPPPAGWIVTYTQAARNANNNLLGATIPNAQNITLRAKIFSHSGSVANQCVDNSPQFRERATSLICRGSSFTYNHNATDDELDSLVYEWTSPLDGFSGTYNEGVNPAFIPFEPAFSFNNPFPGPESLNAATGEITVNSPTAGKYVSAVKVSAYKCGEKVSEIVRELQSVITSNCAAAQTKPTIDPPFPDGSGGFRYNDTVRAGDLVTFSLAARDIASLNLTTIPPYMGDTVFLTATGQQFGTNFTSTTGCLNPPCATLGTQLPAKGLLGVNTTFSWQTDCNHVSFTDRCISGQNTYTFVITATDDECPIPSLNISTISITVVGDTVIESPDVNCVNVLANGDVTLDWDLTPNINNSFTAWMVYSATDRNGPFVLLDSVKTYSTNTYTHVGANADSQPMHYVVRSRSGCKGIVQNVAKDTISTIFVSAITNPTNISVNWNDISNPNPTGSAAQYRVFREYPIGTGFNLYVSTASTSLTETFTPCTDDVKYRVELVNASKGCTSSSNVLNYTFKFPDPQTNFSFPNNQCPGTPISFTNLTTITGGSVTYSWNFGDGSAVSTQTSPSHTYTLAGTYNVVLTAISGQGCDSIITLPISITFPTADAGSNQSICPGGSTPIGGSPTTAGGNTVAWSPAAGLTSTSAFNPIASPTNTTTYTVVVTDGNGCANSAQVTVTVIPSPTADAGNTPTSVCLGSGTLIGGSPTGPAGAVYAWSSIPTGFTSTAANPTVSPTVNTTYTVTVTIGSGTTCTDTDDILVRVNPIPIADAGLDQDICNTFAVQIGGSPTSNTPNVGYLWDNLGTLDDNTIENPIATPTLTTRYSLTVTENTTGCFDTSSVLITVNPIPVVDFTVADTCVGNTTLFTDISSLSSGTITSWFWDFEDAGATSTQQNPSYSFTAIGTYTVKLVVETVIGCKDSTLKTITVVPLPTVDAGADQVICDRDTVLVGGSPTSSTVGVTYLWDNSTTLSDATIANPAAFPNTTTRYSLTVTETATGCTDTASVLIQVNPVPVASYTASAVCANEITQFTDGSSIPSGSIVSWTWDFGDLIGTSTQQNPVYQYTGPGTYQVQLIVESAFGCKDSITNSVIISPKPTPSFTFSNLCENDVTQFTDASSIATGSITSWSWDFGDGVGISTQQNPVYTFGVPNTYNVKLVLRSDFGCTDSTTIPVTISPLPLADAGTDQVICNTGTVQIGGTPTSSTLNVSYLWDNSGSLNDNTLANPDASPTATTRYILTVTENTTGCFDTSSVLVTVNPIPVVDFMIADTCIGNTTLFTDVSSISVGSITTWTWNFGDGVGTSTQQNPSYTYTAPNTYFVKLVVTSAIGCIDSITKTVTILSLPGIDAGTDQGICINDSMTIGGTPTSTGINVSYTWDNAGTLDDNTIANPIAKPLVSTRYKLTVTDLNTGCFDTSSVVISVNPLPTAGFRASQVCINEVTQFADLSNISAPASIQAWTWDFGDNSGTSLLQNPSYTYLAAGTYSVKLVVTTNSGCLDSIVRSVVVDTLPLAFAGLDRTLCELDTTILGKTSVSSETYLWNNATSLTDATIAQPGAFPTVDTRYIVTVTNSNGCISVDSVDITVTLAPDVQAGNDLTICNRDTITIGGTPTSIEPGATYLWNNAASLDDPTLANPRAFPSDTTSFIVTVTDAIGCSSTDTMIVNVNPLANVDFRVDADCEGDFAAFSDISTVTAGNVVSWSWNFGDGVGTSTLQNPGYQYAFPGTYSVLLEVQTFLGCIDSMRKDVTIVALPIADAGNDIAICIGDTVNLGGNPTGPIGSGYSWSPGFDLSSVRDSNPRAYPSSSIIYYLTVTGANGCFSYDTVNVAVNALPLVTAQKDSSLCVDQPVQLSASGAVTYFWSPAIYLDDPTISNPIARALKSTNFVVAGTDNNGCIATDTVFIDVFNLDFTPVDTAICSGDSVVLAPILHGDTNGISYLWSSSNPNNILSNITDSSIKITAGIRQYFTLQIQNALGCVDTDSIYVNMKQAAEVDFDYLNSPRCQNSIIEIQNISTFTDNYIWKLNGEVVSTDMSPDFEINNLANNTVTLIGSNVTCTDSTTEVIEATGLRQLLQLKDANVFTPNGDGLNDIFDPGFQGEFIGCVDFQIFDRWGEKVFDSNIGQYGWDGVTLRGRPAKVGVYYYIIRIGSEEIRSSVYLSR